MRYMIMHRTNAHWESGASPTPELIARVGGLMGELAKSGALLSGEGLRASSLGARVRFSKGRRTVTRGPLGTAKGVPAGFAILRAASLDEAIGWMSRFAELVGDVDIDIRPVTEAWDIGVGSKPDDVTTTRFMAVHTTDDADKGVPPTPRMMAEMGRLIEEMSRAGVFVAGEGLAPTARGARVEASGGRRTVLDGPYAESKELIAGYAIVEVPSLDEAKALAIRYAEVVDADVVDVREVF